MTREEYHRLPVSHAAPPCADCGEAPRLVHTTAVLWHGEGCPVSEAGRRQIGNGHHGRGEEQQ